MAKLSCCLTILLIVHNLPETFNLEICNENCQSEPFLNFEEKLLENLNDTHSASNVTNSKSVNWSYLMLTNKSYSTKYLGNLNLVNGSNYAEQQTGRKHYSNNVILTHNNNNNNNSSKNINNDDDDNEMTNRSDEDYVKMLGQKYLSILPPFNPAYSDAVSPQCRQHAQHFLKALANYELWALKMHDASAKFSSSILNGNINQLGDFDQCLDVEAPDATYRGKYCLTYLQASVPNNAKKLKHLHTLIQSHSLFKSQLEDPGHRVPRFSTINWALCVPSTCSHADVEASLRDFIADSTVGIGVDFRIRVEKEMCQVKNVDWLSQIDRGTLIASSFFLFILMISFLSTLYEYKSEAKNEWLTAFSLIRNTKALVSLERDKNDIYSVHSLRCFNAIMLIVAHKAMALFFQPYTNRTEMSEILGKPFTVLGRAASLYTDPFIMLSGLLTAHSLFGKLQRGQKINFFQEYVGRLLRIVPPLGGLILFCTYILPLLGSGPNWNLVITHHSDICKTYWWRNLLFIHNYFGFENMCLTHTHHVGIDTQLFITTPIIIMIIWKWPKRGSAFVIGLATLSTVARYYVTITKKLSNYIFFGTTVSQLFDTANYMYILPAHRFTVYTMGIFLGYVLRKYKDKKLTNTQIRVGWTINITLLLIAFFGPAPMGKIDYVYNPTHAAYYAAFSPIAWCSFFAWMIFTTHLGHDNYLTPLMSWRGFLITTRLSYAVYLTQFPVFFFNVGLIRGTDHYDFFSSVMKTNELIWIILTSVTLILFFESPFGNIKKAMFRQKPASISSPAPGKDGTLSKKLIKMLDDSPNKDLICNADDKTPKKTN